MAGWECHSEAGGQGHCVDVPVSLAGADDGGPQISGKGMWIVGNVVTERCHRRDEHGQIPL